MKPIKRPNYIKKKKKSISIINMMSAAKSSIGIMNNLINLLKCGTTCSVEESKITDEIKEWQNEQEARLKAIFKIANGDDLRSFDGMIGAWKNQRSRDSLILAFRHVYDGISSSASAVSPNHDNWLFYIAMTDKITESIESDIILDLGKTFTARTL